MPDTLSCDATRLITLIYFSSCLNARSFNCEGQVRPTVLVKKKNDALRYLLLSNRHLMRARRSSSLSDAAECCGWTSVQNTKVSPGGLPLLMIGEVQRVSKLECTEDAFARSPSARLAGQLLTLAQSVRMRRPLQSPSSMNIMPQSNMHLIIKRSCCRQSGTPLQDSVRDSVESAAVWDTLLRIISL
ncbi:hypothetical protein M501DRAFT_995771 [Patellaria atrata CBS 101060]|uniref:Uncharacterized protein n=1 Tax=Patellaria atrata CBS 101060 TaxID=1346257 RepID=A0A9P4S6W0_9PEZI|nr:hypothetical protein M501DRAFT_995771 [Patellaria atrata CBS 101060]